MLRRCDLCFPASVATLALVLTFACAAEPGRSDGPPLVAAPGSPVAVGGEPADVAAGDLDGDGSDDLVIAEGAGDRLVVLLSDGRGGLEAPRVTALPEGSAPHLVALGDMDGDGRLDAALSAHDSNAVILLRGDGRGGFSPFATSPVATGSPEPPHNHGLALADLDGDGDLDLLFGNQDADVITVLLGDGHGAFAPAPGAPAPAGRRPYPFAVGDLDGDGAPDLAVPDLGGATVTLLRGDGQGGFTPFPSSPLATPPGPFHTALADLNEDGTLDLVVSHNDSPRVSIHLGTGKGSFHPAPPAELGIGAWKLAVADLNGDGHIDIAGGTHDNQVHILLGKGDGTFQEGPTLPTNRGTWTTTTADLNGDGKPDLVALGTQAGTVSVWLQQ